MLEIVFGVTKFCRYCREVKVLEDFYENPKLKDGRHNKCKSCDIKKAKKPKVLLEENKLKFYLHSVEFRAVVLERLKYFNLSRKQVPYLFAGMDARALYSWRVYGLSNNRLDTIKIKDYQFDKMFEMLGVHLSKKIIVSKDDDGNDVRLEKLVVILDPLDQTELWKTWQHKFKRPFYNKKYLNDVRTKVKDNTQHGQQSSV